ncbi:MAG: beta-ketoacyl synthase, partial [Verrucomicrobiota bacterium]
LLDVLCSRFTLEALQTLAGGASVLTDEFIGRLRETNPERAFFLDHLLAMSLGDASLIKVNDGYALTTDQRLQTSALDIWNSLFNDSPEYFPLIHCVARVGLHLHALLSGEGKHTLLPSPSVLAPLTQNVLGDSGRMKIALAVKRILSGTLDGLPEGKRLGVMEVSDGVPVFAATVCQALDFDRCGYCFVTTNAETADESRRLLDRFPAMDIRLLEPSLGETAGGVTNGHANDLVIMTCDFSTISAASVALRHARTHLAPGGLIIFIGQYPSRWVDFVYGGRPEWWFTAADGECVSRQQPALFWQKRLEYLGFTSVECLEFLPDTASGPYLLLGRRSAAMDTSEQEPFISADRTWLIIAGKQGYASKLAALLESRLRERGDRCIHLTVWAEKDIETELHRIKTMYGGIRGIVHLAGLNDTPAGAAAETYLESQSGRCVAAAAIIKACETSQTETICWIVTTGAAAHLLPGRVNIRRPANMAAVADAALWGFGRTLMNETAEDAVRMVDLEDSSNLELSATWLARELQQQDPEHEIL